MVRSVKIVLYLDNIDTVKISAQTKIHTDRMLPGSQTHFCSIPNQSYMTGKEFPIISRMIAIIQRYLKILFFKMFLCTKCLYESDYQGILVCLPQKKPSGLVHPRAAIKTNSIPRNYSSHIIVGNPVLAYTLIHILL